MVWETCEGLLLCPVCREPLRQVGHTIRCPQSHSFDLARQGYVHLLLADGKLPEILGDAKEMVRARHRFLTSGAYDPLSERINRTVLWHVEERGMVERTLNLLDVGCGEGTYLSRLQAFLAERLEIPLCVYGMDIAKEAVRMAARDHGGIHFFVASVRRRLLFPDDSIDVLLNVFAPRDPDEFNRVLDPEGILVVAIPGPDHLAGLREEFELLDLEEDKEKGVVEQFGPHFPNVERHPVVYALELSGDRVRDLVRMTPNYWHLSKATWQSLDKVDRRRIWVEFTILTFRR